MCMCVCVLCVFFSITSDTVSLSDILSLSHTHTHYFLCLCIFSLLLSEHTHANNIGYDTISCNNNNGPYIPSPDISHISDDKVNIGGVEFKVVMAEPFQGLVTMNTTIYAQGRAVRRAST